MKRYFGWLIYRSSVLYMFLFAISVGILLAFPVQYVTNVVLGPYSRITAITPVGVMYLIAGLVPLVGLIALYHAVYRSRVIEAEQAGDPLLLVSGVKRSWI